MPKFRLAALVAVSAYTEVEADTLDDAIRASEGRAVEFDGGACTKENHWIIEEPDGSPQNIMLDEDF